MVVVMVFVRMALELRRRYIITNVECTINFRLLQIRNSSSHISQ